ncbi:MAG: tyrosine-type recombinase/integrase, partial [Sphingobacterium sp.]
RARPARVKSQEVAPTFSGNRMRYIRNYLVWQISYFIATHFLEKKLADDLQSSLQNLVLAINARLPPAGYRHSIQQREGLDPEAVSSLMIIVSPLSPDNPWKGVHSRYRNELIVQWFYYLGVRRGELLGVRVEDINFQKNEVTIHRRADDVNDPRLDQPQTKTKARVLPMSSALASLTRDYIINRRSAFKGARKHTFLFCADKTGLPMSLPTVNKLFKELRTACPFLSGPLSPHVLRHTWNDRFSELMDKNGITEEEEKKMRSNLMGWSETSETAAIYTKRHVREKAKIALLKMQEQIINKD